MVLQSRHDARVPSPVRVPWAARSPGQPVQLQAPSDRPALSVRPLDVSQRPGLRESLGGLDLGIQFPESVEIQLSLSVALWPAGQLPRLGRRAVVDELWTLMPIESENDKQVGATIIG